MGAVELVEGRGKFFRILAGETRVRLPHVKDLRREATLLVEARSIAGRTGARRKDGIVPDHTETRLVTVSEKHLPGPDLRAQGGDRLVGAVNHHGIRRGEPRGGKFDRRLHHGA